jgi:predicted ATPase/transcriptional regulator with XRE-family HTH domain
MDSPARARSPTLVEPSRVAWSDPAATAGLATLLRTLRVQAGLSQQMLADRALISVQAVSALERGYRKVPYRKTLERIADALSLPNEARVALELSARRARGERLAEQNAAPAHNLPRQLTSFLGREEVVRDVCTLVETAPLVSIVGTGGAGKTRVAIEVGARLLDRFPDGVWFVELAPIGDPSFVTHALAAALRVPESPQRPLLETLLAYLAQKQLLIVFDNCEHLIFEARRVAGSLLRECPSVALLVTSREVLSVTGERVYRIPPLAVPAERVPTPDQAMKYGAVALFADRVKAADARFAVTHENVESVVEICRRLDGLPLALELAAARAAVLSPKQISERLDLAFELLTGSAQTAVPRHQTMRAVIDWSYELLSSQARLLFDRLAIFAGGFTLETAASVCADGRLPAEDVLELLSSLVAQSLATVDFEGGDARYNFLEATRQYALERLAKRGERQALAHRHARTFLELAQRLDADWYAARERSWFREARAELDNCRVALAWSLSERHDLRSGCLLAGALARVWYSLSSVEGRRWVRLAMESVDESTPGDVLAALYIADAQLCGALGEYKASLASAEHALLLQGILDDLQIARAKQLAGSALGAMGRAFEGEKLLGDALAAAQRLDNRRLAALVLGELGTARTRRGDVDGARRFYAEALAYYVALGLERPAASIAGHLAEVEFAAGDPASALHRAEEARAGHEATQNRRSVAIDLCNMAAYLVALDCYDDARRHASEALLAARDVKSTVLTAYVLQHLAAVGALASYPSKRRAEEGSERAAMLLGFVDARLACLEAQREFTEQQEYDRISSTLGAILGDRLKAVMALGADWTEDGAVAVALEL